MYKILLFISIIITALAVYFNEELKDYIALKFSVNPSSNSKSLEKLFTSEDLKLYNGIDKPEIYLAILGMIFDVTSGSEYYGPGNTYHFFTGKDASRSFVTGKFGENDASDEIADFSQEDLRSINHWTKFYKKEYKRIGKLIGRYYNENGKLTPYGKVVKNLIKSAEKSKEKEDLNKQKFPPCNIEWDAERGTHVWCTNRSGGINRDWVGVPRQLYEPGSKDHRCACINEGDEQLGNLKEYEGCESTSPSCYVKN